MRKFVEMENRGQILEYDENDREEIDQASGSVTLYTINRQARIKVQAFPLPSSVRLFLETRSEDLRSIILGKASLEFNDEIRSSLMDVFHKAGFAKSSATVDQIIAFGPEGFGPNILLNMVEVIYKVNCQHFNILGLSRSVKFLERKADKYKKFGSAAYIRISSGCKFWAYDGRTHGWCWFQVSGNLLPPSV